METPQQLDGEERLIQARTVMNAVQMSMDSQNPQDRAEAEAALRSWESDAAPGFLQALLDIARESTVVSEVQAQDHLCHYMPQRATAGQHSWLP